MDLTSLKAKDGGVWMPEATWRAVLARDAAWQGVHGQAKLCETPSETPATP